MLKKGSVPDFTGQFNLGRRALKALSCAQWDGEGNSKKLRLRKSLKVRKKNLNFSKAAHRKKIILVETLGNDISRRQGKLIRARQVNIIGARQVNISGNQRRWRSGGQFSPLAPCTPPPAGMTLHLEKIAAKKAI